MEEYQLSEIEGDDFEDLLMPPPVLVRQYAFIEQEEDTPQQDDVLIEEVENTYHEVECPICFCSLDEGNTAKLMCGHVLCVEDLQNLKDMSSSSQFKCHICRALQQINFSLTCTSVK